MEIVRTSGQVLLKTKFPSNLIYLNVSEIYTASERSCAETEGEKMVVA
jgi:hypothetical protein